MYYDNECQKRGTDAINVKIVIPENYTMTEERPIFRAYKLWYSSGQTLEKDNGHGCFGGDGPPA
jgi:hypothetical protein